MIRIILTFLISVSFAQARDLTIISNGNNTGISMQIAQENIKEFSDFNVKLKNTNSNCALTKVLWDNVEGPAILGYTTGFDGTLDKNNTMCYIKPEDNNLLFVLFSSPHWFCSVGNKTWEDFIKPKSTHVIALSTPPNQNPEILFNLISKHYDINLKLLRVNTSSEFATLAKASEIDFGLRSGIYGIYKDKCFWNTRDIESNKELSFLKPHTAVYGSLYDDLFYLYKNLTPQQVVDFRHRLLKSWNAEGVLAIINRRGHDISQLDYSSEIAKDITLKKILKRYE